MYTTILIILAIIVFVLALLHGLNQAWDDTGREE